MGENLKFIFINKSAVGKKDLLQLAELLGCDPLISQYLIDPDVRCRHTDNSYRRFSENVAQFFDTEHEIKTNNNKELSSSPWPDFEVLSINLFYGAGYICSE